MTGKEEKTGRLFHFHQKVPIPSYLLALVVGELESRALGPRSRVWSEPSMVDAGAFEFADTDDYLAAGSNVYLSSAMPIEAALQGRHWVESMFGEDTICCFFPHRFLMEEWRIRV